MTDSNAKDKNGDVTFETVMQVIRMGRDEKQGGIVPISRQLKKTLSEYLAGEVKDGVPSETALSVADELYEVVGVTWLAKSLSMKLTDLRDLLGKTEITTCRGQGCDNEVEIHYRRVRGGYSNSHLTSDRHEFCPDCQKEHEERGRQQRRLMRERRAEERLSRLDKEREEEAEKRRVLSQVPWQGSLDDYRHFLAGKSTVAITLRSLAKGVLGNQFPLHILDEDHGWMSIVRHPADGEINLSCTLCGADSNLSLYTTDLRHGVGGRDVLTGIVEAIFDEVANLDEFGWFFASEWLKGRLLAKRPGILLLCPSCEPEKTASPSFNENYFKIPLEAGG